MPLAVADEAIKKSGLGWGRQRLILWGVGAAGAGLFSSSVLLRRQFLPNSQGSHQKAHFLRVPHLANMREPGGVPVPWGNKAWLLPCGWQLASLQQDRWSESI